MPGGHQPNRPEKAPAPSTKSLKKEQKGIWFKASQTKMENGTEEREGCLLGEVKGSICSQERKKGGFSAKSKCKAKIPRYSEKKKKMKGRSDDGNQCERRRKGNSEEKKPLCR